MPYPPGMILRMTFVTIGQTPRDDLVPDLVASLPRSVDVSEVGLLDGVGADAVAALRPGDGEARLVTRLRDGREAVVRSTWAHERMRAVVEGLSAGPDHAVVVLCTGRFEGLASRGLLVQAQEVVDHGVAGLAAAARRIGVVVPLPEQAAAVRPPAGVAAEVWTAAASPYRDADFATAGRALTGCDLVVMHCMGYTDGQRQRVAEASGLPVLLARRLLASALAQLL